MTDAPISYTNLNENIQQPAPPAMPSVPLANDLPSALEAIRALTHGYNIQYGMRSGGNSNNTAPSKPKIGKYSEQKPLRVTKTIKVYSKQDPETFIEVKQINAMTFRDSITGELWTWTR